MTINGWLQILFFFALILTAAKPLGVFMARVFNRERTFLDPVLRPVERLIYRLTGVDEGREMRWTEYAAAMLLFSGVSMVVLYLLQRLQAENPGKPVPVDLATASGSGLDPHISPAAAEFSSTARGARTRDGRR